MTQNRHCLWKDGMKRGMVYVEGWERAAQILALLGRTPTETLPTRPVKPLTDRMLCGAMAVYADARGRAFAWQIAFPVGEWERVEALLATG